MPENFTALIQAVNEKTLIPPAAKRLWEETSDRISIHSKGIRPAFVSQRITNNNGNPFGGNQITPANYDDRYKYLFDNYILNRHPNETYESYQWRLSTFPLIAQEIYLNAKQQILGAIFQTSHYTIKANEDKDNAYLDEIEFSEQCREKIPEFVFNNPHGKIAIVETHITEFGQSEATLPDIELVEARHIISYIEDTLIVFHKCEPINGQKVIYYIDRQYCVKLIEIADKKDEYTLLSHYQHGFGELPVICNDSNFFQSYVTWADMLARNASDDEMIAKNASYPIREIEMPICQMCLGAKRLPDPSRPPTPDNPNMGFLVCPSCNGKGTHSVNPGEDYITPSPEKNDMSPQREKVRYYNPDIEINKFSFDRWQKIRDYGMASMHLKFVEEAQSGTAKAIDREQLYYLLVNIKDKLFDIIEDSLYYILKYRNVGNVAGNIQHLDKPYTVDRPQQFQIKTEDDIQKEYTDLISGNADLSVRRQKMDELMQLVYRGDLVNLKRWNVTKVWDRLYGMNDSELNTRKLLGSAGTNDFIKHDMVDSLLNIISLDKGEQWILNQSVKTIMAEMDIEVKQYLVAAPIDIPAIPAA